MVYVGSADEMAIVAIRPRTAFQPFKTRTGGDGAIKLVRNPADTWDRKEPALASTLLPPIPVKAVHPAQDARHALYHGWKLTLKTFADNLIRIGLQPGSYDVPSERLYL